MALRVLLADESSTIKKVMQLALQDFAVEVKSVPAGVDVLPVTQSFLPDIIFADVLLTKKSGYDVCNELKSNTTSAHIPVVLMWSGFMELDQKKAQQCKADGFLEKPFDANTLRQIVEKLVQKVQSHPLKDFLSFPRLPEFEEAAEAGTVNRESLQIPPSTQSPPPPPIGKDPSKEMEVFAIPEVEENENFQVPGEDFQQVPLNLRKNATLPAENEDNEWQRQDLTQFKLKIPDQKPNLDENAFAKYVIPKEELTAAKIESSGDFEEISFEPAAEKPAAKPILPTATMTSATETKKKTLVSDLNTQSHSGSAAKQDFDIRNQVSKAALQEADYERILREEARAVIENLAWKIIPDLAERVIREELNKLLQDVEKSI
jgi:two-component system cell cycle response regulator